MDASPSMSICRGSCDTPQESTSKRFVFVLVQNFYIIRGLRQYGYDKEADELKRVSLATVRRYYQKVRGRFDRSECNHSVLTVMFISLVDVSARRPMAVCLCVSLCCAVGDGL